MKKKILIEVVGISGMIAILGAYSLSTFGYLSAHSLAYQLMNLTGALAFIYYTSIKKAWASLVVNVAWVAVACIALTKMV